MIVSKIQGSGRDTAILLSGSGVVSVFDNNVRILVDGHYPETYVDIPKSTIIDIFNKYCLPDKELEKYVEAKVFEMVKSEVIKEGFVPTT